MTTQEHQAVADFGGEVYSRIVSDLRQIVSDDELANVVGINSRQVQNWATGRNRPRSENRDHLLEFNYLAQRLREIYHPEGVEIWLHARNREFDGQRPLDLLVAGEFRRVLAAVERLLDGTPS